MFAGRLPPGKNGRIMKTKLMAAKRIGRRASMTGSGEREFMAHG